jgi:hypothetical protein
MIRRDVGSGSTTRILAPRFAAGVSSLRRSDCFSETEIPKPSDVVGGEGLDFFRAPPLE